MGESNGTHQVGNDAGLMPLISSANIACGFHAGDPTVMDATVWLAVRHHVAIGAHPGYPDKENFGRREMSLPADEIEEIIRVQINALAEIVRKHNSKLVHVKPHGALYNQAAKDITIARAIARAVKSFSPSLILVGLAGSKLIEAGQELGLQTAFEGFPERAYEPDGSLRSRSLPGALISDVEKAAEQGLRLAAEGITTSLGGRPRRYPVDTLCIHGDSPGAPEITRALRQKLERAGYLIKGLRK
jgi:UPF0271 protein